MISGQPTGRAIDGEVLQVALKWKDFIVAFVTDDILFEETLHIYLLDQQMDIIDAAHLYWMYCTGIFSNLEIREPNILRFEFFSGITSAVELLNHPTFMFPLFSSPTGVHRPWRLRHHFRLYETVRTNMNEN